MIYRLSCFWSVVAGCASCWPFRGGTSAFPLLRDGPSGWLNPTSSSAVRLVIHRAKLAACGLRLNFPCIGFRLPGVASGIVCIPVLEVL